MIFPPACDLDVLSGGSCDAMTLCSADVGLSFMIALPSFCALALPSGLGSSVRDSGFDFFWLLGALRAFLIPEVFDKMFMLGLCTSFREETCKTKRSPSPRLSIHV